jgi:hypothetical protein
MKSQKEQQVKWDKTFCPKNTKVKYSLFDNDPPLNARIDNKLQNANTLHMENNSEYQNSTQHIRSKIIKESKILKQEIFFPRIHI